MRYESANSNGWSRWAPRLLSVLRIVAGFLFIQPGMMKIFAYPLGMPPTGGTAEFGTQLWIAGWLEVVGGALLILGLWTRPVAFILSGEMAVAYLQAHAPTGYWPILNGGTDAMLFCFLYFYLSAAGGGPWGIDGWLRKRPPSVLMTQRDEEDIHRFEEEGGRHAVEVDYGGGVQGIRSHLVRPGR